MKTYTLTKAQIEELLEKQKFLCGEEFISSPNIDKSYWRILSAPYPNIPETKKEGMIKRLYNRFIYRKSNLI
jgi:hypothetical protein